MTCSYCPGPSNVRVGETYLCDSHYEWARNHGFAWPVTVVKK